VKHLDKRSGKLAVVAHCILNQNSRVMGLAGYPAVIPEAVDLLRQSNVGLLQMPCPELMFAGSQRPPKTREEYDTRPYRTHCTQIALSTVDQLVEFAKNDVELLTVLGVRNSPSCDVGDTPREMGILMDELQIELEKHHLRMPMHAINASGRGLDIRRLATLLEGP
jgi:predicted secreted protein